MLSGGGRTVVVGGSGGREAEKRDAPAFFSSMERVFQSLFWSSSSCWCTASCSSDERRSHWASTFESGMADAALEVVVVVVLPAAGLAVAAMVRTPPTRTARRAR